MSTSDPSVPGGPAAPSDGETPSPSSSAPPRPRRRVRSSWSVWVLVAIVLAAGIGGFALYHLSTAPKPTSNVLTIWTYDGLFGAGLYPAKAYDQVFEAFQNSTGTPVNVVYLSGDLAQALLDAKPSQRPDVVMGLDELEAPEVDAQGLLVPYSPPDLTSVNASLVAAIAPDHSVTPYEYGFLGLDYNLSLLTPSQSSTLTQGDFFSDMPSDPGLAGQLYYPDPVQGDITGEEFLAWEVEYTTNVLHENWTTFWKAVAPYVHPLPDWTTCWSEFTAPVGATPTCLSYTSDPAAEAFFGDGGWMNTSVVHNAGKAWSWRTVYGTGIVAGTSHLADAQKFVDWTLSGQVQSLVPTNEWEYPANASVGLPGAYNWTVPLASLNAVNQFTTPSQSSEELSSWVLQLESIVA